jgi:4'-phosphopantetheinyl transferase
MRPEAVSFAYGKNGKPEVEGIEFNLSHARNRAMIALSHGVAVGIDIEQIRENVEIATLLRRIGENVNSGSTEQLFHAWTRREARIKAMGSGLMDIPPSNVVAIDIDAPSGFAASVALVDRTPLVRYCGEGE